ncbi:MAG: type II toxin-antitoxin system VapC family toxin [Limisphaerales bacterium]
MSWVVDTCLLIDISDADPNFAAGSAALLSAKRIEGLVVAPVTYVELAPVFAGDVARQELFLHHLQVSWSQAWNRAETLAAHAGWHRYVQAKRLLRTPKRPMADILIGGFAERFDGLLTRNETEFRSVFPNLRLVVP